MHYELCIKIAIFATQNSYMHKGLYIIGLLLLLFVACTGDREVRAVLERAEAYLPECPDSASMLLDSISSRSLRESGERVRSLYGLLRTMTDAMEGKGVATDSLIRPSYSYYKEQGTSYENIRRLGRSAFYLAQFEASRDSTKRAEDLYREAIRCSERAEDWRTCYLAYNYLASTITWSNTELAIQLRKQAIDIYNRCKDKPANYISLLNSLSNDYLSVGFADSAFDCANDAYQIACDEQLEQKKYASLRVLSNLYFETGNYPTALELAKQGMYGLNDKTRDASLFSLADCYLACDSIEQAKNTLLSIHSSNPKMQYAVYRKLSQIAIQLHDAPSAIAYSDSLETATVGMFTNIQKTKDEYYQALLQQEQESERQHIASLKQQMIFGICLVAIFMVAVLAYVLFERYKKRQAIAKAQILDKAESLSNSLADTRREYQLFKTDKEQYEKTLQQRFQELEAHNNSMKERIIEYKEDDSELMNSDIVQFFLEKSEGRFGEGKVKRSELSALEKAFRKHLKYSYRKYKQSNLTDFQLQVAILTRLNFTTKEIAQIFDTSQPSISNTKAKINNDLFGENTSESLYNNLLSVKGLKLKE